MFRQTSNENIHKHTQKDIYIYVIHIIQKYKKIKKTHEYCNKTIQNMKRLWKIMKRQDT